MSILIVMLLLVVALLVYAAMTSKEVKVETKEGVLVDVKDVCPACGHALTEEDTECPGCGLHF